MDTCIVLQGPLDQHEMMIECYRSYPHVLWSTWLGEPEDQVAAVEKAGISVIQSPKPHFKGFGHLNFQTTSTTAGILAAKKRGFKYVLKVRQDLVFSDVNTVADLVRASNQLSFMCFHNWRGGYLVDYFSGGPVDEMLVYWDLFSTRMDYNAEVIILESYLSRKRLENRRDYEFISPHFNFLLGDMLELKVEAFWQKINKEITVTYSEDPKFIYE